MLAVACRLRRGVMQAERAGMRMKVLQAQTLATARAWFTKAVPEGACPNNHNLVESLWLRRSGLGLGVVPLPLDVKAEALNKHRLRCTPRFPS